MKKRGGLVDQHAEGLLKKKTIVANLKEDETVDKFPDTRSNAPDENSYVFEEYAHSYDPRKHGTGLGGHFME